MVRDLNGQRGEMGCFCACSAMFGAAKGVTKAWLRLQGGWRSAFGEALEEAPGFPRWLKPRGSGWRDGGTEVPPFQNGELRRRVETET